MTDAFTPSNANASAPPDPQAFDTPPSSHKLGAPETWVDEHGDALFRYAIMRLPDQSAAEDTVQETFLAAVESQDKFQGQSQVRTWLIGILRHKIGDHFRKHRKELQIVESEDGESSIDAMFGRLGHWREPPGRWKVNPEAIAQREEFWLVFEECMKGLGPRTSEVFAMRVLNDSTPVEVCKVLKITTTNLWVHLHRARTGLRACLEARWFNTGSGSSSSESR